jgi:hypothetical protein
VPAARTEAERLIVPDRETVATGRRPGLRAVLVPVLACGLVAAVAVALDAVYSAREGYLARPPDYDGVSYLATSISVHDLALSLHARAALHALNTTLAPLWIVVLAFQQTILGTGPWQAFTARFWAVAPLLVLVYWIVRARASRPLAIAAVILTTLLPVVSAGVRSSVWEFFSDQANYNDDWGLDDIRPDLFAGVLVLWSVALLAEHNHGLRRSRYLLSAAFAAAAVLMKASTAPVTLVAWGAALAVSWYWNRRSEGVARNALLGAGLFVVLLLPWAAGARGVATTINYFYNAAVTFKGAYAMNLSLVDSALYFLVRIPAQLGQLEGWVVIAGSILLAIALLRRRLGRAEWMYAGLVVLFYAAYTATSNKNPHVGEWFTLALWIFFWAGGSRLASARWPAGVNVWSPRLLAAVAVYTLLVYALGAFALLNWPQNEQRANSQLLSVTSGLAAELGRHVTVEQCFTYAPGPGWPGSLQVLLTNADGGSPASTPIDVDPASTTAQYIATASACPAVVVYREDITQVAKAFFCPPVRQPYLRALANWVKSASSGYVLDRSWRFDDLPPIGPHTLGRYQGISLTVDLYLRAPG